MIKPRVSAVEGESAIEQDSESDEHNAAVPYVAASGAGQQPSEGGDRERGGFRGRRRRRGGRRDSRPEGRNDARGDSRSDVRSEGRSDTRSEGRSEGRDRVPERTPEPRYSRPVESALPRHQESGRTQSFGPPAGYQPILLPGESISKYQRFAHSRLLRSRFRGIAGGCSSGICVRAVVGSRQQPSRRMSRSLPARPLLSLSTKSTTMNSRAVHEEQIEAAVYIDRLEPRIPSRRSPGG